ncbi:S9 family peptidase [Halorussus sp. AFM4]|uniref:S9 family peptidase n=1 Tax=Halorussus sp. AFM4 TaxID=3421651 RepID=UPI003EBD7589
MRPISPEDYHEISKVTTGQLDTDPALSPDESRIAYPVKTPKDGMEYESTIFVAPTDGGEPRRFTAPDTVDTDPAWSPSGDRLSFVRVDDSEIRQLYIMPTDGGEPRQATDVIGGVSEYQWSPDGTRIVFTQAATAEEHRLGVDLDKEADPEYEREEPDPRVITRTVYTVHDGFIDGERSHVYVLDIESDTVTRITEGDYDFLSPEWGDASTIYYTSKQTGDPDDNYVQDLLSYDMDSESETQLTQFTFPASFPAAPDISATGDGRIAFTVREAERATMQQTDLALYEVETDEVTLLTDGFDRMIRRLSDRPKWGPDDRYLYFSTPGPGRIPIWRVCADGASTPEAILDEEIHHVTGFEIGEDHLTFSQSEWNHPGDVFIARSDGEDIRRVTTVNEDYLSNRILNKPEEITFENPDGTDIHGYVLTPSDFDPDQTYPLAVEIHGGPHYLWTTAGTMWHEFQCLAAAGYVVFWCNPRGSVGWGEEFMQEIYRDWGGPDYEDIMAGVDTVMERDYVDETNAFVIGGSYGGFMTSWIVGKTDRFKAAVTQRGVNDIAGMYGSTDGYKFLEDEFGTVPWDDHQLLWEHSPAAYVDQVATPTMVMHAEEDYRSTINTSEMFYRGLRKNDVDTCFIRYPREGHELSRAGEPKHVVDRLRRILRWINGYSDHHDEDPALETGFVIDEDATST